MENTIIYTTGIIFIVLLVTYMQITGKITIRKTKLIHHIRYIFAHKSETNFYLKEYAISFKKQISSKNIIIILTTTLLISFVLYNYVFFTVPISNSMIPTFEAGDLILMQKYDTETSIGDIVMFNVALIGKDQIVTHRVYSITPDGIKTKGDNGGIDFWTIPPEQIYAKAITIGKQPIIIKSVGYYFLDAQISPAYTREFGFLQAIVRGGKQLGLLIFVICLVAYTWLSVNDIKKQKKYRRRI